jgi:hypothetical protein
MIARRVLAGVFTVLMSFWLGRNYFFGVEPDLKKCAGLWILCLGSTMIMDGVTSGRMERATSQRKD